MMSVVEQVWGHIHEADVADLCGALVRQPTINPPGQEEAAARLCAEFCRRHGGEVSLLDVAPSRPNVLARFAGGQSSPALAFSGHLDVVPVSQDEQARWTHAPFGGEISDGFVWGRGSADMKGGVAAALAAIAALRASQVELPGDVWFVGTADEEATMLGIKAIVRADVLAGVGAGVICEPTDLEIAHVSKGRTWATLRVLGRTAHAALENGGVNAIEKARALLDRLHEASPRFAPHPAAGRSWWQPTEIRGGIEPAIVPDRCEITLDARLVPGQSTRDLWTDVQHIIDGLEAEDPDFRCQVEVIERREPWEVERSAAIVEAAAAGVRTALGKPAAFGSMLGTTDASYLVPAGVPCVVCGPGSISVVHREDERVAVAHLMAAARAYAATALSYFGLL